LAGSRQIGAGDPLYLRYGVERQTDCFVPEAGSLEFATDEKAVAGVEGVKTGRAMEL
jgi:hypothetical protein